MERYELVIVGGGMVGLTMALALRPMLDLNCSICLIDPAPEPHQKPLESPSFDDRATALSRYTLNIFNTLGLTTLHQHASPITAIEVSDRGHAGYHHMKASEQGFDEYGAVVANKTLGQLLWQEASKLNIQYRFNQRVSSINPNQNGHQLILDNGDQLSSQYVLLCDGGRSGLHKQLGLQEKTHDFHARARIATVKTELSHQGKAFERFTESGPIALLPFGGFSALVWTLPDNAYQSVSRLDKDAALSWLNQQFGQRLGGITAISDWQEYPLIEKQLPVSISHGFIALGNAAATLHPVAGQGFNLAIRGIMRCAAVLNEQYQTSQSLPDFRQWQALSDDIKNDQSNTVLISKKLIQLFESPNVATQLGRGIGLNSLDRHPLISQSFALAGMGLIQNAPTYSDL
jgi:2-octaprenyl-6-methoxyphenol hydroxylase